VPPYFNALALTKRARLGASDPVPTKQLDFVQLLWPWALVSTMIVGKAACSAVTIPSAGPSAGTLRCAIRALQGSLIRRRRGQALDDPTDRAVRPQAVEANAHTDLGTAQPVAQRTCQCE
jgi:hypothetical protein